MRKGRQVLILVIASLILIVQFLSCQSLPQNDSQQVLKDKIEWTPFPSPVIDGESVVKLNEETVSMPLWYWKKIVAYVSDVETNISILNDN